MTILTTGLGSANGNDLTVVAVDLGGTQIRAAMITSDRVMVNRCSTPTPNTLDSRAVIDTAAAQIERVLQATNRPVDAIGVSVLGPVDVEHGIIRSAPTILGFDNVALGPELEDRFGLPVHLINDANAAALAEWTLGSGRGTTTFCYVTVSTGIGCGIIVDGQLLLGHEGHAGELGHILVPDPDGGLVALEDLASGTAIARLGQRIRLSEQDAPAPTARSVAEAAHNGDERARSIFTRAATVLGLQLGNLVRLINPETIALGGGVARAGEVFWEPVRRSLTESLSRHNLHVPELVSAELADDAGLHGAAIEVCRRYAEGSLRQRP